MKSKNGHLRISWEKINLLWTDDLNFISFRLWPGPDHVLKNEYQQEVKESIRKKWFESWIGWLWSWWSYRVIAGIWDEADASDLLVGVKMFIEWGGVVECLVGKGWEGRFEWVASFTAVGVLTGQWESKRMKNG